MQGIDSGFTVKSDFGINTNMSLRHWTNLLPDPEVAQLSFVPASSSPPTPHFFDHNPSSEVYASVDLRHTLTAAHVPSASVLDDRYSTSHKMPTFGNMKSSALVEAALSPPKGLTVQAIPHVQRIPGFIPSPVQMNDHFRHSVDPSLRLADLIEAGDSTNTKDSAECSRTQGESSNKKRRHSTQSGSDHEYIEGTTRVRSKKAVQRYKSRRITRTTRTTSTDDRGETVTITVPPAARKTPIRSNPRKPAPQRLIRKKPVGTKVPETLDAANEADRMMWLWKNQGKGWEQIRTEWARLTGVKPGQSSLSVRYIKLNENFARNGAASDLELLKFRREAEEELLASMWERVAEKMVQFNPLSEHNPKDLKKRYDLIVRSGFDLSKVPAYNPVTKKEDEEEIEVTTQGNLNERENKSTSFATQEPDLDPNNSTSTPADDQGRSPVSSKVNQDDVIASIETPANDFSHALAEYGEGIAFEAYTADTENAYAYGDQDFTHSEVASVFDHQAPSSVRTGHLAGAMVSSSGRPVRLPFFPPCGNTAASTNHSLVSYDSESD